MSAEVAPATNGYGHGETAVGTENISALNGDNGSEDDGDLFGDDGEAAEENENRKLDDAELDSGDDEGRVDRVAATVEDDDMPEPEEKDFKVMSVDLARVKYPEGNELYSLGMPPYLGLRHRNYDAATYEPPTKPHDGRDPATDPSFKFSAFSTAASTIYWRRDPQTPELLQSNSRIIKWSDGSLTLQMASNPKDHYRIDVKALRQSFNRKKGQAPIEYDPNRDTHNYLAAPHASQGVDLQVVRPLDAQFKIQPTGDLANLSIEKLQANIAAANKTHDPLDAIRQVTINPEKARLDAEQFEKDRIRMARRRENAEDRLLLRKDRVLGSSGLGRSRGGAGGLSVAGLEADDDGMPTARGKNRSKMAAAAAAARRRRTNRRGDIYSDDEDEDYPRGRTREDEYDREDDFLADSDLEPETYEDGDEEEDAMEDDEDEEEQGQNEPEAAEKKRSLINKEPKRPAGDVDEEELLDDVAGGNSTAAASGPPGSPQARKKRRVIDDDEDDDE